MAPVLTLSAHRALVKLYRMLDCGSWAIDGPQPGQFAKMSTFLSLHSSETWQPPTCNIFTAKQVKQHGGQPVEVKLSLPFVAALSS